MNLAAMHPVMADALRVIAAQHMTAPQVEAAPEVSVEDDIETGRCDYCDRPGAHRYPADTLACPACAERDGLPAPLN